MLINIIGLGYIGLPTALVMAAHGLQIIGTDKDENKISLLKAGQLTFKETGLQELFEAAVNEGIVFSNICQCADIYIIAVPTPFDKKSKKVIADFLVTAAKDVLEKCKKNSIIVVESTVSPGTIDTYIRPLVNTKNTEAGFGVSIAHAPERIIPYREKTSFWFWSYLIT